ncbi:hypothetical protein R1sor_016311 [Riccia sorocarpa]|uniref:Uncharacterized protein n=1 Tax=Riccia sorocarpa TaxID=122646 RepID=A0ABD3HEM9_9MARC
MSGANVSVSVHHKGRDAVLRPYDSDTSGFILDAARKGVASVSIGWGKNACRFDLSTMKQLKRDPREESEDIVIEVPFTAKNLKAAGEADGLRRKILVMALDQIREEQFSSRSLDVKGVPYQSVRANPYLKSGHSPYENFLDSLTTATAPLQSEGITLYGQPMKPCVPLMNKVDETLRSLDEQGLHFVFHGTNEAVMDDILKTGLLPSFRISSPGDRDWFGTAYEKSLRYTRSKTKSRTGDRVGTASVSLKLLMLRGARGKAMTRTGNSLLYFLVLHSPGSCSHGEDFITCTSNLFQLQVAEITLK